MQKIFEKIRDVKFDYHLGTFKAVDHANTKNEHDHLWDVFQMGPVCVHRNSFESHEARPFYSSVEQNNGTYLYHECTWRKHFPAQRRG